MHRRRDAGRLAGLGRGLLRSGEPGLRRTRAREAAVTAASTASRRRLACLDLETCWLPTRAGTYRRAMPTSLSLWRTAAWFAARSCSACWPPRGFGASSRTSAGSMVRRIHALARSDGVAGRVLRVAGAVSDKSTLPKHPSSDATRNFSGSGVRRLRGGTRGTLH